MKNWATLPNFTIMVDFAGFLNTYGDVLVWIGGSLIFLAILRGLANAYHGVRKFTKSL